VFALIVFKVFQKLSLPYKIVNFLLASLKLLTNFENDFEILLKIPSLIGRCFLVPSSYWLQGKCARINLSQAASGMHFLCQNRRFRVFEAVTGRISKNSK
jgi:hypothetical protein